MTKGETRGQIFHGGCHSGRMSYANVLGELAQVLPALTESYEILLLKEGGYASLQKEEGQRDEMAAALRRSSCRCRYLWPDGIERRTDSATAPRQCELVEQCERCKILAKIDGGAS